MDDNVQDGDRDGASEFYESLAAACRRMVWFSFLLYLEYASHQLEIKSLSIAGGHRIIGPAFRSFFRMVDHFSIIIRGLI
jgi:hypothetical protein